MAGEGFTAFAPPGFTTEKRTSSNGEPLLRPNTPAEDDDTLVAFVRDVNPRADVLEQTSVLESARRLVDKAVDVSRREVRWPGAQKAVLVQWTEQQRQPDRAGQVRPARSVPCNSAPRSTTG